MTRGIARPGSGLRLLCLLLLGGLLLGCQSLPRPAPAAPDVEAWLARLNHQARVLRSVDAEAGLELRSPQRHDRGDVILVLDKPDRMFLEITGPTGLVALATLDGGGFRFYDARQRRGLHGPVTPYSMARVMPWVMMPAQLVPLLCATPPLLDVPPGPARWDGRQGRWQVELRRPERGLVQTLWFDPAGDLLALELHTLEGTKAHLNYAVRYLKWRRAGDSDLSFPRFIRLQHPESGVEVTLRLRGEPILNGDLTPELFMLVFPEGTPLEYVPGSADESALPGEDPIRDLLGD